MPSRIPLNLRRLQALPALGEQINQYLAKKGLPKFWIGGPNLGEGYTIRFLSPRGAPKSYPIIVDYRIGEPEERTFSRVWMLPVEGPLVQTDSELAAPAAAEEPPPPTAELEPAPEPAPALKRSRRRAEPPEGA